MRTFLLLLTILVGAVAQAYVVPTYRDLKPATQQMIELQVITSPLLAVTTRLTNGGTLTTSQANTISSFTAQPDVARNIVITPTGTTSNVAACTAVITGTNIFSKTITENIPISATQSTATTGSKAFKTVTSVLFPSACTSGSGVTVNIGTGAKLGLKSCLYSPDYFFHAGYGGAKETTAPTIVMGSSTAVEQNTAQLNTALDGAHRVDLFYMQNFVCHP